ncbi:MAG: WD40/YVTN/BNR-like repeat-containing protein [Phycisphaerales bacterium]
MHCFKSAVVVFVGIGLSSLLTLTGCDAGESSYELASSVEETDRFEERPDQPINAAAFRYGQRLGEDGAIPPGALLRAKEQRDALLELQGDNAGISPESWEWIGPGNIGGRLRAIVIHPDDPNTIWVGAASGGIWKTTDGGANWRPLEDFLSTLSVGCMIIDPRDPDRLWVGTGEGFFDTLEGSSNTAAVRGAGLFHSFDGGETWSGKYLSSDWDFVNRLALSPTNSDTLLAATNAGLFRSTDGGFGWTQTASLRAFDVKFHPSDPNMAIASGDHHDWGPYYSTDGGVTWSTAAGIGECDRIELAYSPSNPDIIYAAVSDNWSVDIWRSTDGGRNYTRRAATGFRTYSAYNSTIWVDPTNSDVVVYGSVWLYRSTNGGASFTQTFRDVHADQHVIVEDPGFDGVTNSRVYFGCDGGIYRTDSVYQGSTVNLNNNLGVTQFYGGAINDETGVVLGGTQDNGTLRYGGDPQDWLHMFGGDGGYCAADPTDPNYFYGEVQWARIFRSTNGGLSASYIYNTQNPIWEAGTTDVNFIPYFLLDPNDSNRMLVAGRHLWRSNNVKAPSPDWFTIKDPIGGNAPGQKVEQNHFAENSPWNISTITVAEGDSDIVFVGYNNGQVWYTTDGLATNPSWTRIDNNGETPLPARWISNIRIDPHRPGRVFVSLMGYEADNLWKSDFPFERWHVVDGFQSYRIPSVPISALALHPTQPGWIYAGTDIGVFTSMDGGRSWKTTNDGPSSAPVEQLIWRNDRELLAVTHGRGMYLAEVETGLTLEPPTPGRAGERNTLVAGGGRPGSFIYFAASSELGSASVPGCPDLIVDLQAPTIIGSTTPNDRGEAREDIFVPGRLRDRTVHFQAVDHDFCRKSPPVSHTFN